MTTRNKLPAVTILLASIIGFLSSESKASQLSPDTAEYDRVSNLLGIPREKMSDIYPALALHRDAINEQIATQGDNERLGWLQFISIRTHAKTTVQAIRPYLTKRDAQLVMRNLHTFLVPDSIRPNQRQPLGELFDLKQPRYDGFPRVSSPEISRIIYPTQTNCGYSNLKYEC